MKHLRIPLIIMAIVAAFFFRDDSRPEQAPESPQAITMGDQRTPRGYEDVVIIVNDTVDVGQYITIDSSINAWEVNLSEPITTREVIELREKRYSRYNVDILSGIMWIVVFLFLMFLGTLK